VPNSRRKIAIVADDNTGATDAAGMLTSCGARALLILDAGLLEKTESRLPAGYDVVVVSTRIRSIEPDEAYETTRKVLQGLKAQGFDSIQMKYCSTFDSTERGNIGQSLDAACDLLGFASTVVCPALPVNGRTTYQGYHFVHDRLLSESPLSRHPLNPMTDSFLPRWLGYQTQREIGRIDFHTIRRGVEAIRAERRRLESEGVSYIVTDALEQSDIDLTVEAYGDAEFLSGGSGISQAYGNLYFAEAEAADYGGRLASLPEGLVVISGSESPAAARQRQYALSHGFAEVTVHPLEILETEGAEDFERLVETTASSIASHYTGGRSVVVALDRRSGGDVEHVNEKAGVRGLTPVDMGNLIGSFLGRVAAGLVHEHRLARLLVAGGETSGSVCYECGFEALEVGLPIDPGVPFCFPVHLSGAGGSSDAAAGDSPAGEREEGPTNSPLVVLKSGNFGAEDLYLRTARLG